MTAERITTLFTRYMEGNVTEAERLELSALTLMAENTPLLKSLEQEYWEKMKGSEEGVTEEEVKMLLHSIGVSKPTIVKSLFWRRIAVAASITILLGMGSYFIFFNKSNEKTPIVKVPETQDVKAPETNRAMITLANGQRVYLDSVANGQLATQGNVNVSKTADGQIVYNGSATAVEYNTMFNPRGSKVQPLTLSDGTKVWLNSESSLRFPTAFAGNERKVEITGEAYFEVAKDAAKKFIVTGNGITTEVLGTHFNVNTYADESSIKVTLLEGSVKVTKGNAFGLLKPGQQAQVGADPSTPLRVTSNVNVDEVMAWKNGRFAYNNTDLETIMRQMARWYNVEVVYKDKISDRYTVTTTRDVPVSELFKYIEMSGGVHFKIEDRTITVMK